MLQDGPVPKRFLDERGAQAAEELVGSLTSSADQ